MRRDTLIDFARPALRRGRVPEARAFLSRRLFVATLAPVTLLVGSRGRTAAKVQPRLAADRDRALRAVVDRLLPGDELPGGVALEIDRRMAATTDPELKASVAAALAWLDRRARRYGAGRFAALDHVRQDAILEAALTSEEDGARAIVWSLRKQAFELYYTHPQIMAAFAYSGPPQPLGFPDFERPPA